MPPSPPDGFRAAPSAEPPGTQGSGAREGVPVRHRGQTGRNGPPLEGRSPGRSPVLGRRGCSGTPAPGLRSTRRAVRRPEWMPSPRRPARRGRTFRTGPPPARRPPWHPAAQSRRPGGRYPPDGTSPWRAGRCRRPSRSRRTAATAPARPLRWRSGPDPPP